MKYYIQKSTLFCVRFLQIAGLLLTGLFFLSGLLTTCYAENMTTQEVLTTRDNPLITLLGILLFLALLLPVHRMLRTFQPFRKWLLWAVFGVYLILGACLILFSKTVPAADALSVYSMAEQTAAGNMSVIHNTDSYISYYPQQVGLMLFFETLIRLWNLLPLSLPAYHFIKCVYVLLALIIIYFQYRSVQLLWPDTAADGLYLLAAGVNAPLLMYTSFVYGEIPSFASFSIGMYFLLRYMKEESEAGKHPLYRLLYALIACTISVMLRKNSLILIIAMVIVVFLHGMRHQSGRLLFYALVLGICSLSILPLVQRSYELRSGSIIRSGVPAISYFAMGMQNSSRGNGWYNGFNFETYQSTGMDSAATAVISQNAIQERLFYFREHPSYAADFYLHKYLSQWADGTYACRQATLATYGGRIPFFQSLYEGSGSHLLIQYCNAYQNTLYLGCFLFFLSVNPLPKRRKIQATGEELSSWSSQLPLYLGFIGVIGGFLFHMLWEANSRYIFCFGLLLLPYGAAGLDFLLTKLYPNNTFRPGK